MAAYEIVLKFKKAYAGFQKAMKYSNKHWQEYDEKKRKVVINNFKKKYCEPLDIVASQLDIQDIERFEQGKL